MNTDENRDALRTAVGNTAPRVLVVDDCRASADALGAYLTAGGMEVRTVYHGSDALREARNWRPECIVLDVAMPGLSGIGVAAALRRMEATATIALLAFTAYDTLDQLQEMKKSGIRGSLSEAGGIKSARKPDLTIDGTNAGRSGSDRRASAAWLIVVRAASGTSGDNR